jgi:hypothetical protein
MSETANLAAALVAFQAEMPTVKKSQTAKVPTKAGGSYSYTYAGLADVMREAMPILTRHGLAFTALPRLAERGYELRGTLLHSSGESIEGSLPIAGNTPQEMGSSLTYMRRYLFGCMTGLVTDDDDDGQLAQGVAAKAARKPRATAPERGASPDAVTPAQVTKIAAAMSEAGITQRDNALKYVTDVIGREVASRNELTKAEASRVIEALEKDLAHPFPINVEKP